MTEPICTNSFIYIYIYMYIIIYNSKHLADLFKQQKHKKFMILKVKSKYILTRHKSRTKQWSIAEMKKRKKKKKKKLVFRWIRTRTDQVKFQCSIHSAKESTLWRSCQRLNIYLQIGHNPSRQILKEGVQGCKEILFPRHESRNKRKHHSWNEKKKKNPPVVVFEPGRSR